jgi:type I restriction enzyme M protein
MPRKAAKKKSKSKRGVKRVKSAKKTSIAGKKRSIRRRESATKAKKRAGRRTSTTPKRKVRAKTRRKTTSASSKAATSRRTKTHTARRRVSQKHGGGANLGFEEKMWMAADKLRGKIDPAEYKHVVLGLIFLKYISDHFEEFRAQLALDPEANLEDRDEYKAENVFWVPLESRWNRLKAAARQPKIGKRVDDAMLAIERDNSSLRNVLPRDYGRPQLGDLRLSQLVDLISGIGLGDRESRSNDVLGRVYEYFLGEFASAEGKGGGEFYTPRCVVNLLVELLEPYKGRVFDPACGSGGMFVQSEDFVLRHSGSPKDLAIYGQESNHTTWRLSQMNMAIRGIDANIKWNQGGSFHQDAFPDLKADFLMANPPFNDSDWGGERLREDVRWKFGVPPVSNANYAWIQHFISHLAASGLAAFVMANISLSSDQGGEGTIRKSIIEADLVDAIIALPGQLFYTTPIAVCIWVIARNKKNSKFRDRSRETLFIDGRRLGTMVDRTHRVLTPSDVESVSSTYHAWRSLGSSFAARRGFSAAASIDTIRDNRYILNPGRYVGAEADAEATDTAEQRLRQLAITLRTHFGESLRLEKEIEQTLSRLVGKK